MYQIILTENKKKVKVLYSYTREHDALYRFDKLKSREVHFPKESVWREKTLTPVLYEVLLLREKGDGEVQTNVKIDDDKWVVLDVTNYHEEEAFNVTGANRKLSAKEIIDNVIIPRLSEKNPKQVVILNNKIAIEGLSLNVVTCKNTNESRRLYNYFRTYCFDNKIDDVIFMGSVTDIKVKKQWYKKIHERTGMGMNRLYRKSSR